MASVQTVTVLITDLVGSTGLESRVGPAVADELRGEHFGLIREALEDAGGREVKNTGDGLMLVFDSAAAAVECAAGIQQRFERRNRSAPEQLVVKVGVSMGDATAEDEDYFGMPVIEAARLCDRCTGGQILATELVAHLAAGRGQKFSSVGALELKGLPEPLSVVEVVWERRSEERRLLPLPARLQEAPPVGLIGRADEGDRLTELVGEVAGGERRLVLLCGEPGIGKTRLSTHAALAARSEHGAAVLFGHCEEEVSVPYGPWVEALSHYVEHAPEDLLRAHAQRHGGELGRLVPGIRSRVPSLSPARSSDPETERYLLWGAVVGLLQAASEREPLVAILDDLHWADKPSLLLLRHVLVEGHRIRALMIGTYRDSELHQGHPLAEVLADLYRFDGVERLALTGLAQTEIVQMMERAGGHELDEAGLSLAGELHRETDGNPFYTGELLRHLLESGVIYQQANGRFTVRGDTTSLGLPQSVRDVLGRRIARLGQEEHKVLSIAAVIGRDFDLELLLAVSERDEDELLELLERALAASVLNESSTTPGRFYFAHALISHTLYEDLSVTRRARLHRRIAEALEAQLGDEPGARVGELAHHWAKATTAVDADKAVGYARMAGERALEDLAPDEALRWFEQALELLGDREEPTLRCDLLIGLGEAQRLTGAADYRQTLLDASGLASQRQDGERAARAALANSRGQTSAFGHVDQERVAAIERALELDDDPERRARLLSLQALELVYEHDHRHRRALAEQALAIARQVGSPRTIARVLIDCLYALWAPDVLELRLGYLDELAAAVQAAGDPWLEFWAAVREFDTTVEAGQFERADNAAQRQTAIAERLGEPTVRWTEAFSVGGCRAMLRGDLAAAERHVEQALRIGSEAGEPDAALIYGGQISLLRKIQGRSQEIVELLEQSVQANPLISAMKAGLANILSWLDRRDEAAAIVAEAARDRFEHMPWDAVRMSALVLYADAASRAGVTDAAEMLYELIEPWGDQVVWNGATAYGHARTYLGLLAATLDRHEQADDHFARAIEIQERDGMLVWAARAHLGWAEALAARGETGRAREHATRALELSREHGYGLFEPRAAAILEAGAPVG